MCMQFVFHMHAQTDYTITIIMCPTVNTFNLLASSKQFLQYTHAALDLQVHEMNFQVWMDRANIIIMCVFLDCVDLVQLSYNNNLYIPSTTH